MPPINFLPRKGCKRDCNTGSSARRTRPKVRESVLQELWFRSWSIWRKAKPSRMFVSSKMARLTFDAILGCEEISMVDCFRALKDQETDGSDWSGPVAYMGGKRCKRSHALPLRQEVLMNNPRKASRIKSLNLSELYRLRGCPSTETNTLTWINWLVQRLLAVSQPQWLAQSWTYILQTAKAEGKYD